MAAGYHINSRQSCASPFLPNTINYPFFLHTLLSFIAGLIRRFSGDKSNANFFKILGSDDTSLLIGARNIVYNLALPSLEENVDQVRYHFCSSFSDSLWPEIHYSDLLTFEKRIFGSLNSTNKGIKFNILMQLRLNYFKNWYRILTSIKNCGTIKFICSVIPAI